MNDTPPPPQRIPNTQGKLSPLEAGCLGAAAGVGCVAEGCVLAPLGCVTFAPVGCTGCLALAMGGVMAVTAPFVAGFADAQAGGIGAAAPYELLGLGGLVYGGYGAFSGAQKADIFIGAQDKELRNTHIATGAGIGASLGLAFAGFLYGTGYLFGSRS